MLDQPIGRFGDLMSVRSYDYRRVRRQLTWRIGVVSGIVLTVAIGAYPFLPRSYTATASILLHGTNQEGVTTWDQSQRDAMDDNAIQSKIDLLKSDPVQMQVINSFHLMDDPEFNAALHPSFLRRTLADVPWLAKWLPPTPNSDIQVRANLVKHLTVTREKKSYVIRVAYETSDPRKSNALTDALVYAFLKDQLGRKRLSHESLLKALDDRTTILNARVQDDERAERAFIVESGLAHSGELDSMRKQLETLSVAVAAAHKNTVEALAKADLLAASVKNGTLTQTSQAQSASVLQHLQERYIELSTGTFGQAAPMGANQSVVLTLKAGIEVEAAKLVRASQYDAVVAQQIETSLRQEIARIDARLMKAQEDELHRQDLHRTVQTSIDALNGANVRFMQEAGRGDVLQPDVEIVSLADVPDRPSFPSPMLYGIGTLALLIVLDGLMLLPTLMRIAARAR